MGIFQWFKNLCFIFQELDNDLCFLPGFDLYLPLNWLLTVQLS